MTTSWVDPLLLSTSTQVESTTPPRRHAARLVDLDAAAFEMGELASSQPRPAPNSPIAFEIDEEGGLIASDLTGAVYGYGWTQSEAIADFEGALRDHLAFLREHHAELAPRLRAQLVHLERLFPEL